MKADYFAEFRRPQAKSAGNTGNWVTNPEKFKEPSSLYPGASVTLASEPWVTRVTEPRLDSNVTQVTQPASARVTGDQRQKAKQNQGNSETVTTVTRVTEKNSNDERAAADSDRAHWTRTITPSSRNPIIEPEVRAKIETIEAGARAQGWPAELLYNSNFWDCPRGLAAVLDPDDEIADLTPEFITILKRRRDLVRFCRHAS